MSYDLICSRESMISFLQGCHSSDDGISYDWSVACPSSKKVVMYRNCPGCGFLFYLPMNHGGSLVVAPRGAYHAKPKQTLHSFVLIYASINLHARDTKKKKKETEGILLLMRLVVHELWFDLFKGKHDFFPTGLSLFWWWDFLRLVSCVPFLKKGGHV